MAAAFLNALDPSGQYTFQTVNPPRIFNGTLDRYFRPLARLSLKGAGIYVTVNETDLKGRANENITRIRAIPADFDGTDPANFDRLPFDPSIIVESSPKKYWGWYLVEDGPVLDWQNNPAGCEAIKEDYKRLVDDLARLMESDPKVKSLSHVGRLPGFLRMRDRQRVFVSRIRHFHPEVKYKYEVLKASVAEALVKYGPVLKPRPSKSGTSASPDGRAVLPPPTGRSTIGEAARGGIRDKGPAPAWTPFEEAKLRTALAFRGKTGERIWDPDDDRDTWGLKVAPAITSLSWGTHGEDVFIWWTRQATQPKYQPGGDKFADDALCRSTVRSYKPTRGPNDATDGTIYDRAYKAGWDGNPDPTLLAALAGPASTLPNGAAGAPQTAQPASLPMRSHLLASTVLESVWASEIEARGIDWLWLEHFSHGALGLIVGLPGEGKGQVISYMAACVTCGLPLPCGGGTAPKGNVVLLSSEDAPDIAIKPRLLAAGADCRCVKILKMVQETDAKTGSRTKRMLNLASDLALLKQAIIETGNVRLVLIDPISSYFGAGKVDTFRDTDVRAVLGPICDLAAELHVAIIGIMHFNKKVDVTNAMLRISSSIAFPAVARHTYACINDPENKRRLFVKVKNNYAPDTQLALAYSFSTKVVGTDAYTKKEIKAPYVEWHAHPVDVTAMEAMQAAIDNKNPGARDAAKKFLQEMLAAGPVLRKQIEEAAQGNGISERTLWRAKDNLKVTAEKTNAGWVWALPPPPLAEAMKTDGAVSLMMQDSRSGPGEVSAMLRSGRQPAPQQKMLGGPTKIAEEVDLEMSRRLHQDQDDPVAQEWKAKWCTAGYGLPPPRVADIGEQEARAWLRERARQLLPEVKRWQAERWEAEKARWQAKQGDPP